MTKIVAEKIVADAESAYERMIQEAVQSVRTSHLIPYCNKHKVSFRSGNGEWYMRNADGTAHANCWEYDRLPVRLAKVMNIQIYYGRQCLGSYLGAYVWYTIDA